MCTVAYYTAYLFERWNLFLPDLFNNWTNYAQVDIISIINPLNWFGVIEIWVTQVEIVWAVNVVINISIFCNKINSKRPPGYNWPQAIMSLCYTKYSIMTIIMNINIVLKS